MPKLNEKQTDEVYGKAEEALGQTAQALHAQAMLAWDLRTTPDAMRILSFVWGRNARHLSRAVSRWPTYFMTVDGQAPPVLEPDEFQVLFMLASLPGEVAEDFRKKWRQYSWRAWRVRQAVEDWRSEQKDRKLLRVRGAGTVLKVEPYAKDTQVTLSVPNGKNAPKLAWKGKAVQFHLTEVKDA